jgi:hypothetical protein
MPQLRGKIIGMHLSGMVLLGSFAYRSLQLVYGSRGVMKQRIAQECLDQEESARPVNSMTELHDGAKPIH